MQNKQVLIVGGGAAGLFAADALSNSHEVTIIEKGPAIGRKFLVAGQGGLNITNNCGGTELFGKYTPEGWMNRFLNDFGPAEFRKWLSDLGIPTFVGSSGKVFPEKGIMVIDVLNKIKRRLEERNVRILTGHTFTGFDAQGNITLMYDNSAVILKTTRLILALGGASWPQTGSDGAWKDILFSAGIPVKPFQSSNCGINIQWPEAIIRNHEGKPLKNIQLTAGNVFVKGEALITEYGLEGNAVYALIPELRTCINKGQKALIRIDFKPAVSVEQLLKKFIGQSMSRDYAKAFNLSSEQMAIIKAYTTKEEFLDPGRFVGKLKDLEIQIDSLRPVEEAISVVGGIDPEEINEDLSLKKYPWITVIGEMIDWDAPTGGFLLQGCFSMANYAARAINNYSRNASPLCPSLIP